MTEEQNFKPVSQKDLHVKDIERIFKILEDESLENEIDQLLTEAIRLLEQILQTYADKKVTLIVGGKSRRLTELLLEGLQARLPSDHSLSSLISNRVRLDDKGNRNLYGEGTSLQIEQGDAIEASWPPELPISQENFYIIIDDHTLGRTKAGKTLRTAYKHGQNAAFFSFVGANAGSRLGQSSIETLRPVDSFSKEEFDRKIYIACIGGKINELIESLSLLLSSFVDMRLNQRSFHQGNILESELAKLPPEHQAALKKVSLAMNKLRQMVSKSKTNNETT